MEHMRKYLLWHSCLFEIVNHPLDPPNTIPIYVRVKLNYPNDAGVDGTAGGDANHNLRFILLCRERQIPIDPTSADFRNANVSAFPNHEFKIAEESPSGGNCLEVNEFVAFSEEHMAQMR